MSENYVSNDERNKVYELCKKQLGGKWAEVNESDLVVKPVPDGFVNKLYFCFLPDHLKTKHNKVVVRYVDYDEYKDFLNKTHLITISLIVSHVGISPKILSFYENGSIIEFIKCRYFNANDDLNNKTVELLAQKLAKFHLLEMPIPKDTVQYVFDAVFEKWFDEALRKSYKEGAVRQQIEEHKYPVFLKLNLIDEVVWLRKTMEGLNCPLVLSHNDLNRRNILIREEEGSELEMFLIDFDWTSYHYRGIDFGMYFACWRQKEIDFGYINFPSDQQMSVFIDAYIKEMSKINCSSYAKQEINCRQQLIKEAKVCALFAFVKDIFQCIWQTTMLGDKTIMVKAEERFRCYDELKTKILNEYKL